MITHYCCYLVFSILLSNNCFFTCYPLILIPTSAIYSFHLIPFPNNSPYPTLHNAKHTTPLPPFFSINPFHSTRTSTHLKTNTPILHIFNYASWMILNTCFSYYTSPRNPPPT